MRRSPKRALPRQSGAPVLWFAFGIAVPGSVGGRRSVTGRKPSEQRETVAHVSVQPSPAFILSTRYAAVDTETIGIVLIVLGLLGFFVDDLSHATEEEKSVGPIDVEVPEKNTISTGPAIPDVLLDGGRPVGSGRPRLSLLQHRPDADGFNRDGTQTRPSKDTRYVALTRDPTEARQRLPFVNM